MKPKIVCYIGCSMPKCAKQTGNARTYGCDACEYIKDNELYRCNKFIAFSGKGPQSEDIYKDSWACSEAWMPTLILENAMNIKGMTQATESFRNEVSKGDTISNSLLHIEHNIFIFISLIFLIFFCIF